LKKKVIDLELSKIRMKKLQTIINFDREVGWRRVKSESCSKQGNQSCGQFRRGLGSTNIPKNPPFTISFLICKYYLGIFQVF